MLFRSVRGAPSRAVARLALGCLLAGGGGCAMAGFGGALKLNITDQQTRQLAVRVDAGAADARVFEIASSGETELGTGSAQIDRYVLHRATFGRNISVGYFLCAKPCNDPLASYLVAFSPDQLFVADGQLELRFRVVASNGQAEELVRLVSADMLPALWQDPTITTGPTRRD